MADYNFENLDPSNFEEFVIALGTSYIGNGLMPFGAGPDGGREATFKGKMDYPSKKKGWDGYLVMQCKQKQRLGATPKADADWAIRQLDKEMKAYQDDAGARTLPEYYIFVTNVILSPASKTGGKDRFMEALKAWCSKLGIKDSDVWDRDKISRMLDGKQDIAKRYGYLHAGDLIHAMAERSINKSEKLIEKNKGLHNTLLVFLEKELLIDQNVRLTQAGYVGDENTPLARVFVDLKAKRRDDANESFYVVDTVQQITDCILKPSVIEFERSIHNRNNQSQLKHKKWDNVSRFVFIGGPGQGKSTLAQHLAQRHRAALLLNESIQNSNRSVSEVLAVIQDAAIESKIGLPEHPRFPFRIILEQFADALAKDGIESVVEYIAHTISSRVGKKVSVTEIERHLKKYPWFIAFDGLDEVPTTSNRLDVMNAVNTFTAATHFMDADLLVIATTRPQGYNREFSPSNFNHLVLTPLDIDEAIRYAQKFVDVKYASDAQQRERIMNRLRVATAEEATARLMQSPLQVTIMAALVDVVGNPPRERYPLFNKYYEIVYQREQERGLKLSVILGDYKGIINKIHDHIGLLLQIEAESKGNAKGRIDEERLKNVILKQLEKAGYKGEKLAVIQEDIIKVALLRLVFIVPLEDGQFGFEVRSLQEFAAARALTQGSYKNVKNRIRLISPIPYWRNTVLFGIGRAFDAENDEQCDMIVQLCRELNSIKTDTLLARTLAGSRLALDILEDGIVDRRPRYRENLLGIALDLIGTSFHESVHLLLKQYTNEDEALFAKAIRAAIIEADYFFSTGAFIALANLSNQGLKWAEKLLITSWPEEIAKQRFLLENIGHIINWEQWIIEKAEKIAKESSIRWCAVHLSNFISIPWIRAARHLIIGYAGSQFEQEQITIIPLHVKSGNNTFCYKLNSDLPSKEIIEAIAEANPIHPEWLPFIKGATCFHELNADSIANSLENIAESIGKEDVFFHSRDYNIPWVFNVILHNSNSSQELIQQAHRLRTGHFGDTKDWASAEARWRSKGFDLSDLSIFKEADWPFTKEIAKHGIAPLSTLTAANYSRPNNDIQGLLDTFKSTNNVNLKKEVAGVISSTLSIMIEVYNKKNTGANMETLFALSKYSTQDFDAYFILKIAEEDPDFEIASGAQVLDSIGKLMNHYVMNDYAELSQSKKTFYNKLAAIIAPMYNRKQQREGILRLLATLVASGMKVKLDFFDYDSLSMQGKSDLLIIFLYGQSHHEIGADTVAMYINQLWQAASPPATEIFLDILQMYAFSLSDFAIDVYSRLLANSELDFNYRQLIANELLYQTRFKTSRLGSPRKQEKLSLA